MTIDIILYVRRPRSWPGSTRQAIRRARFHADEASRVVRPRPFDQSISEPRGRLRASRQASGAGGTKRTPLVQSFRFGGPHDGPAAGPQLIVDIGSASPFFPWNVWNVAARDIVRSRAPVVDDGHVRLIGQRGLQRLEVSGVVSGHDEEFANHACFPGPMLPGAIFARPHRVSHRDAPSLGPRIGSG